MTYFHASDKAIDYHPRVRRVSANLKEEPAIVDGRKTFDKIATNVRRAYDKLPPYMVGCHIHS
jgi:hypothetical protein